MRRREPKCGWIRLCWRASAVADCVSWQPHCEAERDVVYQESTVADGTRNPPGWSAVDVINDGLSQANWLSPVLPQERVGVITTLRLHANGSGVWESRPRGCWPERVADRADRGTTLQCRRAQVGTRQGDWLSTARRTTRPGRIVRRSPLTRGRIRWRVPRQR
jgi:hypothetical protein